MYIAVVCLLLITGIAFMVAELFLLPGFGIAGITSFLCLIGSVAVSYVKVHPIYPWAGHATLVAALLLSALAIYAFLRSHAIEKMALNTKIDSEVQLAPRGKKMDNLEKETEKK